MRLHGALSLAALLLVASAFAGVAAPLLGRAETPVDRPGTIAVTGTGVVTTQPDTVTMSFGVTANGATARGATEKCSRVLARVITALKDAGIASKDLQTEWVSVSRRWDVDEDRHAVGYTASSSVSAVVRDLDRTGSVIDVAVAAGANEVNGPSIVRENADALYRDALTAAVTDARAKARTLAEAGGASVGAVQSIVESPEEQAPTPYSTAYPARAATDTVFEPGTTDITATVRVVFALA